MTQPTTTGGRKPRTVPVIPFNLIETRFRLASYYWGSKFCPAVFRFTDGGND